MTTQTPEPPRRRRRPLRPDPAGVHPDQGRTRCEPQGLRRARVARQGAAQAVHGGLGGQPPGSARSPTRSRRCSRSGPRCGRRRRASRPPRSLRALTRQRRQLTAAVTARARALAAENGQKVTSAVSDQVEATLTAAMVDEDCAAAVRSGLLVAPSRAPGSRPSSSAPRWRCRRRSASVPARARPGRPCRRPGRVSLHVVPDPDADRKAIAAARERLEKAEQEVARATEALNAAATDVADLGVRSLQIQGEPRRARRYCGPRGERRGGRRRPRRRRGGPGRGGGDRRQAKDRDAAAAALARLDPEA